jgi:hypothetical protein
VVERQQPSPFPDTEADTGKIEHKFVLYAKLAHTFDHFSSADQVTFVELAEAMVDMAPKDRETIFELVSRLRK